MKLNGALKPHHGAPPPPPVNGSSFGIKKYRDKKRECSSAAPPTTTKQQQQPKQQHQQQLQVVEVEKKEQEQGEKEEKSIVFNITTIITRQYTNNNNNNGSNNHCENVKETIQTVASSNKICNKNAITSTTAATNIKCNDDNNNNNNNNNNTNKIIEILCNSKNSNIFATNADKCKMSTKIDNETEAVADTADCRYHCRSLAVSSSSLPSLSSSSSLPLQSRLRCATAILSQSTSLPPALLNESVGSSSRIVNVAAELMGRAQQSLKQQLLSCSNTTITIMNVTSSPAMKLAAILCLLYATVLLPTAVRCDENDNFFAVNSFSIGPETTTPEFDYASRGQKKFGDKCENTLECGFPGSICDPKKKSCQCTEDLPVTNHFDKCGKEAAVNESCFFNEQCEMKYFQTECRDGRCVCRFEMSPAWGKDGTVECKGRQEKRGPGTYIDPAMIGVLVGMALMFIIICVVLRLFSQARWRENRTIFNTPNPRLMNVSLLRDSKLLHGQERRGSRMSVRAPSRQPSMVSLRPHSPNPSLGKTGRMTRSKSNTRSSESRVSDVSNCSRLLEHPHNAHHIPHTHSYTHTIHNVPTPPHSAALTPNAYAAASAAAAAAANTTNSHHHHQHHHHNTITTTTTYVAASSPGGDADPDTNTSPCDLTLDAPPAVAIQMNKF